MLPLCYGIQQPHRAIALGQAFAQKFAANTAGLGKGEIVLFRALQNTLLAIAHPPQLVVEEYHGGAHQVRFSGTGTYARGNARCELSDLMVIAYDRQTKNARLSYIQAKSERGVSANASGISGKLLSANLEQWYLLGTRPAITGVGSFNPPADLLSSALLHSIGAFAFFLHGSANVDIYYATAAFLQVPLQYNSRYGKLAATADACRCGPYPECLSVYGNVEFGALLFGLMIGTPILSNGQSAAPIGTWLAGQLRGFATLATAADRTVDLANELAELLDPDQTPAAQPPNVGATSLLILGIGPADGRKH